jgi:integrase
MAKKLTAAAVDRIQAGKARREVLDGGCPGLYLVVQPSGVKSWVVRYRRKGRERASRSFKRTLGRASDLTLAEARDAARDVLKQVRKGEDPRDAKAREGGATVATVVEEWLLRDPGPRRRKRPKRERTVREVRRLFEVELARWRDRPVDAVTEAEWQKLVDRVADRSESRAVKLHAYLHRMLRWAASRKLVPTNTMAGVQRPALPASRDRVLTDDELGLAWRAAGDLRLPFGPAIQLLALTAARRDEILSLRWSEVDLAKAEVRLSGDRTKSGEARTIPLSDAAVGILKSVPRLVTAGENGEKSESDFVFTTTGRTAASGFSRAKRRIDATVVERAAAEARKAKREPVRVAPWRLHDLRRTAATGMQRLGQRLEVIEAVLGHVGGSRAGIVGVYQRHAFDDEKRAALALWAEHVVSGNA